MSKRVFLSVAILVLAACSGGGRVELAIDTCMGEVATRLQGKSFEVDRAQLAASGATQDAGKETLDLSAPIVFDRGLASELTQTLRCTVRFDGQTASVINLQFIWELGELKKPE
ncbi:MAG: hypothetical protein E6Q43_03750 [Dokdonella sp.]|nr:MAG: hypothetical protein EYC71_08910 [Gammaproteobacteria bacterium]TXI75239.1 MAG: hypothetical protein E6Q43_03750 [Dokdonella sp.]